MIDQIQQLLHQIDFEKFYKDKVVIKNKIGNELIGLCCFHDDKIPSFSVNIKTGLWNCFGECGRGGNIFQFVQESENVDFIQAAKTLANFAGFELKLEKTKPPIDSRLPQQYLKKLLQTKEELDWLKQNKGLTLKTIKKYEIGWDGNRYTIPIYDEKKFLKNIRRYSGTQKPKMVSFKVKKFTYGKGRIYGLDEMLSHPDEPVVFCEGEWDRLLASQLGFLGAITGTTGAQTFKPEWKQFFGGRDVVIIYDMDPAGREGADNVVKALTGVAVSIKNVELPLARTEEEKDFADYFLKKEATLDDLKKLIETTPLSIIEKETQKEEAPEKLASFVSIDLKENIDRRVQTPLSVSGETSEAFHGVSKFRVPHCDQYTNGKCNRCPPEKIFAISNGEKEFIESCMSTEAQVIGFLRQRICPFGRRPQIKILEKATVREFFATQRTKRFFSKIGNISVDEMGAELVERKVYFVSDKFIKPQAYLATGYIRTHPKTQQVCLLATELQPLEEEYESFTLTEDVKKNLNKLRRLGPEAIVDILGKEILFLRQRTELILVVLLTYCSPLRLHFNQMDIRGWINAIILGDTSTGKTALATRLADYINIGDIVSGLSSSRTGITYGLREHKQKGWQIKIGRYPANTRKFVCIDEIQFLRKGDIRTLGKAMDEGFLIIDRIAEKSLESMTRLVALANPKDDSTMDELMFGCEGFKKLFDKAIIRRFDLALCLSHTDVKIEELNLPNLMIDSPKLPKQILRDLVFWAWTRPLDAVRISEKTTKRILEQTTILSKKFGYALDVPLVAPGDFSNKLARLATAYAILCISTDSEFHSIDVKPEHVDFISTFIDFVYSGEGFALKEYSEIYRKKTQLDDYDEIKKTLERAKEQEKFGTNEEKKITRLEKLLYILKMHNEVRRKELAEQLGVDEKTISRKISLLQRFNLVDSQTRGYFKKPKFIKFLRKLALDKKTTLNIDRAFEDMKLPEELEEETFL